MPEIFDTDEFKNNYHETVDIENVNIDRFSILECNINARNRSKFTSNLFYNKKIVLFKTSININKNCQHFYKMLTIYPYALEVSYKNNPKFFNILEQIDKKISEKICIDLKKYIGLFDYHNNVNFNSDSDLFDDKVLCLFKISKNMPKIDDWVAIDNFQNSSKMDIIFKICGKADIIKWPDGRRRYYTELKVVKLNFVKT